MEWDGFIKNRIVANCEILWTREWNLVLHKIWRISWPTEEVRF